MATSSKVRCELGYARRLERGRGVSDSSKVHSSASVGFEHQNVPMSGRALHCLDDLSGMHRLRYRHARTAQTINDQG